MGFIGVSAQGGRTELWFHLEHSLTSGVGQFNFNFTYANHMLQDGKRAQRSLNKRGRRLLARILPMQGVRSMFVRANRLEVLVWTEEAWEGLLVPIVAVIREETGDLQAQVGLETQFMEPGRWPAPLLEVMFG